MYIIGHISLIFSIGHDVHVIVKACEPMPLVLQADVMSRELQIAQLTDYTTDSLPLLLLQVVILYCIKKTLIPNSFCFGIVTVIIQHAKVDISVSMSLPSCNNLC